MNTQASRAIKLFGTEQPVNPLRANPGNIRQTMNFDDPRQRDPLGAA